MSALFGVSLHSMFSMVSGVRSMASRRMGVGVPPSRDYRSRDALPILRDGERRA